VLTFKPALPLPQKPGVHRVAIAVDCQAQQFTIPVRITLPPKFNASNRYPVLLFLHDADAKMDSDGYCAQGPDLEFDTNTGFSKLYPFIGISPQCPRDRQWQQRVIAKSLTLAVQALLKAVPADSDRIYATGAGAGATALWGLSNDLPGCFAALAPINACEFNAPGLATKLHDLPIRMIAGVKNGGAYDGANAMSTLLANNEPKLDLIFENEMGNEAAQHHYSNAELYNWLLAHQHGGEHAKRSALFWLPMAMLGLAGALFFASLLMLSNKKAHAGSPPKAANPA
jgi:predicted peptidase